MSTTVGVETFEERRLRAYFSQLSAMIGPAQGVGIAVVAHMVSNSVSFLPALSKIAPIRLLLPKPKTEGTADARRIASLGYTSHALSREWSAEARVCAPIFLGSLPEGERLLIVDIGGYFANSIAEINRLLDGRVVGVMEGTENGAQKYEAAGLEHGIPVATVARSPLKLPEDYLVGASIVFSIEAVLREQAQILQTRSACVIGYGRVGSGVAEVLRGRGIPTVVYDKSAIAMAEASARGFRAFRRLDDALSGASLVVSATGGRALDGRAMANLRPGTVVATVTSADDEFVEADLRALRRTEISDSLVRYDSGGQDYFWLINDGGPANFLHGAVIGPAIQLIEGEKLAAVKCLASGDFDNSSPRLLEVESSTREMVAGIWNEHFLND